MKMRKGDIWGEGGALSRIIEGYEHRPQQEEFASRVRETIDDGGVLVAEAPTGVGKSLAYLVPAVDWAVSAGGRVIVSTNTKNLQDQLYNQDIPKVAALLGGRVDAMVVKGRSNYACLRRWSLLGAGQMDISSIRKPADGLSELGAWIDSTETGDLAEFVRGSGAGRGDLVDAVRVEEGLCDPSTCSVGDSCFLRRLRKRMSRAQVLCVNHAILLGQLLGCWDILPPFDVMILDESHNLHKVAADRLGIRLSSGPLNRSVSRLLAAAAVGRRGEAARRNPHAGKLADALRGAAENVEILFGGLREVLSASKDGRSLRYRRDSKLSRTVIDLGGPLLRSCREVEEKLGGAIEESSLSEEALEQLEAEHALWTDMTGDLEHLLTPGDREGVFWIDSAPSLRWAPTDVSDQLGPALDGACEATVLTSATLTVWGDFEYFKSTIGLTRENSSYPRCVRLGSPFDPEESVLFLVPGDAPDPREDSYTAYVAGAVESVLDSTGRKALVLFTSHYMLRAVRGLLKGRTEAGVLAQGVDGERTEITKAFKESHCGALLGTSSFWEGVDFPGEEVELLMIARLPFPVPSDPVVEGRSETLEAKGIEPFRNYLLPEAVMRLRQGFGRLIRSGADRGVVIMLDPRMVRASYGRAFVESLPVGPRVLADIDAVAEAAAGWFQGVMNSA